MVTEVNEEPIELTLLHRTSAIPPLSRTSARTANPRRRTFAAATPARLPEMSLIRLDGGFDAVETREYALTPSILQWTQWKCLQLFHLEHQDLLIYTAL